MRAWYVDRRNEPILDVRMMVSFACALILVLSWLLPREEFFRQMLAEGEADHVSIAYARLLTALNPGDPELKALLAAQYLQIGELQQAWQVIGDEDGSASLLRANILLRLAYSSEDDEQRDAWETLLITLLEQAAQDPALDEASAVAFAEAAYAVHRPELAANYFERRYRSGLEIDDLLRAATAWQAADRPGRAADLFATLIGAGFPLNMDPLASAELIARGLDSFLAASRFADGFTFVDAAVAAGHTQPDLIVRYVVFAQRADDPARMRHYLAAFEDTEGLSESALLQLAGAAIGGGELEHAARFMETLLLRRPDDLEMRQELARVYRWSNRPEAALDQWLDLVERSGADEFRTVAWRLAHGLYRYDLSARLLTELSRQRRLSDEEVLTLYDAYGLEGAPEAGIRVLMDYLEAYPAHREAWILLTRLQQDNGSLLAASESWAAFSHHHRLDVKERLLWADLLWEQYRTEEAVDLLLAAEKSDHAEYWRRLSAYAWFLDDMTLVARSYEALSALEALDRDHFDRFLMALMLTNPAEAQRQAELGWETFKEPAYLVQALQWAMAAGDYQLMNSLLLRAEAEQSRFADSAAYWELLAFYHQQQGDLDTAGRVLASGLNYHPARVSLIAPYLWILIEAADAERLREVLRTYQPLAEDSPVLWQAYAAAFARLQEHRLAIAWYARAAAAQADDLPLLLAYANSLNSLGLGDPAFRLRRYVISELAEGRRTSDLELMTIADAGRGVLTAQQEQALVHWLIDTRIDAEGRESLSTQLPRFYLAQSLQLAHYSAAGFWLQRDREPDVWQQLAVAADQGDTRLLVSLLEHRDPSVRINAALALDRPEVAYRDAGSPLLSDENRLGLASTYHARYPTGWQISPERSRLSELDIESLTFTTSGRIGTYWLGGSAAGFVLSDALRLRSGESREWLLDGHAGRRNRFGEFEGGISLLGSADELIPGFTLDQTFFLDSRNRVQLGGAYQQLTEITALARAVSQRSGLDVGWQSLLGRRDRFSANASLDYYQDRFGDALGQGWQAEARFDHAINLIGPELLVGTSLYMTANDEQAPGSKLLERLLIDGGEFLLPEGTGRLALNASISRGAPGDLRWELPSPRYRLGASVGYQWPENSPTLAFEASVGIRMLGNDELSFKAAYTSDLLSAVGGDGYRATLIYSKRLGR